MTPEEIQQIILSEQLSINAPTNPSDAVSYLCGLIAELTIKLEEQEKLIKSITNEK